MHQYEGTSVQGNWRKDLYDSIKKAEKFLYLSAPSLNPNILLLLDESDEKKSVTIGELLEEKRRQGKILSSYVLNKD